MLNSVKHMYEAPLLPGASAHPLVEIIAPELYGRVWHDSYAICTISSHESSPTLVSPHFGKSFPYGELVFVSANALYLK